jgi:hypothetical protein
MDIDTAEVVRRLAEADQDGSSAAKGKALEETIGLVFGLIPGMNLTETNALNAAGSEEIDVVFFNEQEREGLWFIDVIVIVECKNWSGRVTSEQVNSFKTKLERRQRHIGILVASNGITGNSHPPSAAHDSIQSALRDGVEILVITRGELEALTTTDELCALLKAKRVELAAFGTVRLQK